MKKIVILILCVLMTASCATTNNPKYSVRKPKKEYIEDYSEAMEILKIDFPEIYKLFCDGKVRLNEMYTYYDMNGRKRVKVNFGYVTSSNNFYIW